MDASHIKAAAQGRWREILPQLGIDSRFLTGRHNPCPFCGGSDRFRFDDRAGGGSALCSQCGAHHDGIGLAGRALGLSAPEDFPRLLAAVGEALGLSPEATATRTAHPEPGQGGTSPGIQSRAARAEQAAIRARGIWDAASPAPEDHPYLAKKGVQPHGARLYRGPLTLAGQACDGSLLVPLRNSDGGLTTLQFIRGDGSKLLLPGGAKAGSSLTLGRMAEPATLLVCEGFSTAASLHEVTGYPTIAAVDAGNLLHVATSLRARFPKARIIICADDDIKSSDNPGLRYATAAAKAVQGWLALPDFGSNRPENSSDFNDLHRHCGGAAVLRCIELAKPVAEEFRQAEIPRRGFFLTPVSDLIKKPSTSRWLIRGLLPADALVVLVGDPAAGKSFLALDLAARLATGHSPEANPEIVSGPVVYVAGEGHHGITRRLLAWFRYHAIDADSVPLFVSSTGLALDTAEGLDAAQRAIDEVAATHGPPVAIFVDTLHRNMSGDENSALDLGRLIRATDSLRARFGGSVVLVHHSGHLDKTRGRGSSSLRAAVDAEFILSVTGANRELRCSKMKDFEPPHPRAFKLEQVDLPWRNEDGSFETSAVIIPARMGDTHAPATMSAAEELGLKTLKEAAEGSGDDSATLEAWRENFYRRHHGDSVEAKKKAFQRVRTVLLKSGSIRVCDDVYSVPSANRDTGTGRDIAGTSRNLSRDTGTVPGHVPAMSRQPSHRSGTGRDTPLKGCPAVPVTVRESHPNYEEF